MLWCCSAVVLWGGVVGQVQYGWGQSVGQQSVGQQNVGQQNVGQQVEPGVSEQQQW